MEKLFTIFCDCTDCKFCDEDEQCDAPFFIEIENGQCITYEEGEYEG